MTPGSGEPRAVPARGPGDAYSEASMTGASDASHEVGRQAMTRDACVVLPTYNERDNLAPMVNALLAVSPSVRVLVVDDGSPDGTGAVADQLAAANPLRVRVLHRRAKEGLGAAYVAGFRVALASGAERIFEMDADFSHPVAAVQEMLRLAETHDVVVGSRYVAGGSLDRRWGVGRRLLSWGGNQYARALTGLRVRDATAGFKCFRREALEALPLGDVRSQGYNFQIEMAMRCQQAGLRVVEFPIHFAERTRGASKMTARIALEALWRTAHLAVLLRTNRGGPRRTP